MANSNQIKQSLITNISVIDKFPTDLLTQIETVLVNTDTLVSDDDEDEETSTTNDITIDGDSDDHLYQIGETPLLIDPFDNYRLFTLYKDYSDPTTPLDLSDGATLYLVFKYNSKEIRIVEFTPDNPYINVDKTNGQVLFKITKKQASDIMSLKNHVFYITRVYTTYDSASNTQISSDEEVIYSGYWADRTSENQTTLTETITNLKEAITARDSLIEDLQATISSLIEQNTDYATQVEELTTELENSQTEIKELAGDSTGASEGELLDPNTVVVTYQGDINSEDFVEEVTESVPDLVTSMRNLSITDYLIG